MFAFIFNSGYSSSANHRADVFACFLYQQGNISFFTEIALLARIVPIPSIFITWKKGKTTNHSEVYLPTDKLNKDENYLIRLKAFGICIAEQYARTEKEILRTSPRGIIYLKGTRDISTLIKKR